MFSGLLHVWLYFLVFLDVTSSGVSKLFAGETKSLLGSAKFVSINKNVHLKRSFITNLELRNQARNFGRSINCMPAKKIDTETVLS